MENKKSKKKWWIGIIVAVVLAMVGVIFFYQKSSAKVLTKAEYVKEVIVQNEQFESVLDSFLDQVSSYNGSKSDTEKLDNTAAKFTEFVEALEKDLGPRVSSESKSHYDQMIAAYKLYLEAIELYRTSTPKNLGDERTALMAEAKTKLNVAKEAMKNIQ